jgi:thiamine biosynthesis lipoprotein
MAVGHHAVHVLGTVVSFELRDPIPPAAFREAVRVLDHADSMFSVTRPDSDIMRLRRGEIRIEDCHPDVEEVLSLCEEAASDTDGYFTAYPYGNLDPAGLVKGWAVQRASEVLTEAGSRSHAVNGCGDIQVVGDPDRWPPWRIGITDPINRNRLLAIVERQDGAVATCGNAARGLHVVNPLTGRPADHFSTVTIVAPTLLEADVLATAAFARGATAVGWIDYLPGVQGLFATKAGRTGWTTGFPLSTSDAEPAVITG